MMKNGKKMTLIEVWQDVLPGKFPKSAAINALAGRWEVTERNAYNRLKSGNLKNFVHDVSFLHTKYGIGFNMDTGFFFDEKQYDLIVQKEDMENAKMFTLSKTF